jgi:hypothetical protein
MESNNIELIEAYLNGSLTPTEQELVEKRLRTEDAFKEDYEMYQLMVGAITENRKAELKTFIRQNAKVKPAPFFKTPTFYAAAAASVVFGILGYFVIYQQLDEQKSTAQQQEPTPEKTAQNNTTDPGENITTTTYDSTSNKAPKTPKEKEDGDIVAFRDKDELKTDRDRESNSGVDDMSGKGDDVKVEKDRMKADTFLFVPQKIYVAKPKQYQTSPTDLYEVVVAGNARKIEVQCWESPINYSGYHLQKDLLMIYGNYDISKASFQVLKNILYMKYKNDYYRLTANEAFAPLKKETDAKVIADLEIK